jgi:hypothetical protein
VETVQDFIRSVSDAVLNPIIILLFVVALLYFFWGIYMFIANAESSEEREKGKQHLMYAVIGFLIMVSVYGLIGLMKATLGV